MIYYIDVDNTICRTKDADYKNARPLKGRISKINKLYKDNKVVFWTARGAVSGLNWLPFTKDQLDTWGVKYHELLQKPHFDLLVDDKALSDKQYFDGN